MATTWAADLHLRYDPTSRRLDGRAVLSVRATQKLTRFNLDLSGLKVTALTVDHVKAGFRRSGQELIISPRRALHRNQTFQVAISYTGVPTTVIDPDRSKDGWIPTDDGVFVAGEPQGSMSWFPATTTPRTRPPTTSRSPSPRDAPRSPTASSWASRPRVRKTTFRWRQSEPMASYLATATVGKFKVSGTHHRQWHKGLQRRRSAPARPPPPRPC